VHSSQKPYIVPERRKN